MRYCTLLYLNISHFWGNSTVTPILLVVHTKLIGCATTHYGPPFISLYHVIILSLNCITVHLPFKYNFNLVSDYINCFAIHSFVSNSTLNKFVGSRLHIQSSMWRLISLEEGGHWDPWRDKYFWGGGDLQCGYFALRILVCK